MFGALIGVCWGGVSICVRGGLVDVLLERKMGGNVLCYLLL